jgi:hypothetical protein
MGGHGGVHRLLLSPGPVLLVLQYQLRCSHLAADKMNDGSSKNVKPGCWLQPVQRPLMQRTCTASATMNSTAWVPAAAKPPTCSSAQWCS